MDALEAQRIAQETQDVLASKSAADCIVSASAFPVPPLHSLTQPVSEDTVMCTPARMHASLVDCVCVKVFKSFAEPHGCGSLQVADEEDILEMQQVRPVSSALTVQCVAACQLPQ